MTSTPCCPTTVDFNADGIPDLVIAAEDGYFYYMANPLKAQDSARRTH